MPTQKDVPTMKTNKKPKRVLSLILLALLIFQQSNVVVFADEVSNPGESQPQVVAGGGIDAN